MKRYIHSDTREPDLVIEAVFDTKFSVDSVAAATYKGIDVPEGPLPYFDLLN